MSLGGGFDERVREASFPKILALVRTSNGRVDLGRARRGSERELRHRSSERLSERMILQLVCSLFFSWTVGRVPAGAFEHVQGVLVISCFDAPTDLPYHPSAPDLAEHERHDEEDKETAVHDVQRLCCVPDLLHAPPCKEVCRESELEDPVGLQPLRASVSSASDDESLRPVGVKDCSAHMDEIALQ